MSQDYNGSQTRDEISTRLAITVARLEAGLPPPEADNDDQVGVVHVAPGEWSAALATNQTAKWRRWDTTTPVDLATINTLCARPAERESKDGVCYVAGSLVGTERKAPAVKRIDMLVYDLDGSTLADIESKIRDAGVLAWLHSTHSHLSTETLVATNHLERWAKARGVHYPLSVDDMQRYVADPANRKTYLRSVSYDPSPEALKQTTEGLMAVVSHEPCAKYRLIIPLASPIVLSRLGASSAAMIAAYKAIYHGVAQTLGLDHDRACEDPSRLYYWASHKPGAADDYVAEIYGGSLDDETVPLLDWTDESRWVRARPEDKGKSSKGAGSAKTPRKSAETKSKHLVTTPEGVTVDLMRLPADLDIESVVRSALDAAEIGADRERGGYHLTCPNEHKHSKPGGQGCFAANANDEHPSWNLYCSHNGCADDDKFDRLARLVEDGRVTASDLGLEDDNDTLSALQGAAYDHGLTVAYDEDMRGYVTYRPGRGKDQPAIPVLLSSPIKIIGRGYIGTKPHLIISALLTTGQWVTSPLDLSDLATNPEGKIRALGVRSAQAKQLSSILAAVVTDDHVTVVNQPGWTGSSYVMPSGDVIGDDAVHMTAKALKGYEAGGTLEGANDLMASIQGQSRLMLTTMQSLAAPIAARLGVQMGGLNLYGPSSIGKTSALKVAVSVHGKGAGEDHGGLVGSANTTGFAAERNAAARNDSVVALDEIKTADPDVIETILYVIPNGASRQAGTSSGGLRDAVSWSVLTLVTGEMSAADYLKGAGKASYAGQQVRMVDVPADAGKGYGVLDSVPDGFASAGAYIDYINEAARTHYGWHVPALIREYQTDPVAYEDAARAAANRVVLDDGNSQVRRVAQRWALMAGICIVAAEHGVVPWSAEAIIEATQSCFRAWIESRGGTAAGEVIEAERAFERYVWTNPGAFADEQFVEPDPSRNRYGVRTRVMDGGETYIEYQIPDLESLAVMLGGQIERCQPWLESLRDGKSESWALIATKGLKRRSRKIGGWAYCIRRKASEDERRDGSDDPLAPVVADKSPLPTRRRT